MNKKQYPIGIDLGTVNSLVAVHRNRKTEIIQCQGYKMTPSVVFYHPDEDEVSVGNIEELDIKEQYDAIYDSKRLIGRSFDDINLENCRNKFQFTIEATETNKIHIPIIHDGKKVYKTPYEVSAEILKKLKASAEDYLGYKIKEAVITVPAYFTFSQRHATKIAAKLAELDVLMLLNEPTAACLHYIKEREQENSLSLVFDLGGGTLDISIIKMSESGVKVIAVDGDTWLGGRNFDEALLEYIVDKNDLTLNKREHIRLLKFIEKIKHNLSFNLKASKYIENFNNRKDFTIKITRSEFETAISPLLETCIKIIERCLNKAGLEKNEIENIILVGGSTKIPKIKQLVQEFFEKEVSTDLDPDEAVACGAAIQASSMKRLIKTELIIVDVTPFSLGIRTIFDAMLTVLKCNTPVPAENFVEPVTTSHNQSKISLMVYEGERSRCKLNNFLGKFEIKNVPQKPAGQITVIITFAIDESGLLKVTAKEKSTGVTSELEIGVELSDLKSNHKASMTTETEEDKQFLEFVTNLHELKNICVQYMLDKNDSENNVKACKKFISGLRILDFEERSKLFDLVKSFKEELGDERLLQQISSIKI